MTFNPEKHLIELQGKAYLEVKWRLVWFRQECPNGSIRTEEMHVDLDREIEAEIPTGKWIDNPNRPGKKMPEKMKVKKAGYARFKAIVEDGKGGHAEATKTEYAAAFDDYVEKAETGAIGRALALLGYGTQFTGDELAENHRIVDAPVERGRAASQGDTSNPAKESVEGQRVNSADVRTRPAPSTLANGATHDTVPSRATNQTTNTVTSIQTGQDEKNKNEPPTIKELQKMCAELFGPGQWQTLLVKKFGQNMKEVTPDHREQLAVYLEKCKAAK